MKFSLSQIFWWSTLVILLIGYVLRFDFEFTFDKRLNVPPASPGSDSIFDWNNRTYDFYFNLEIKPVPYKYELEIIKIDTRQPYPC